MYKQAFPCEHFIIFLICLKLKSLGATALIIALSGIFDIFLSFFRKHHIELRVLYISDTLTCNQITFHLPSEMLSILIVLLPSLQLHNHHLHSFCFPSRKINHLSVSISSHSYIGLCHIVSFQPNISLINKILC